METVMDAKLIKVEFSSESDQDQALLAAALLIRYILKKITRVRSKNDR